MQLFCFFFFNDTATTEIYTLSLHDALPISSSARSAPSNGVDTGAKTPRIRPICGESVIMIMLLRNLLDKVSEHLDRKSTRLNSSHANISYAVFCLKKKKNQL